MSVGPVTVACGCTSLGHIVQERLGHANIAMTLDLYSHVTSDMQRHAADALEAKIASAEQRSA
jgi:integrase